MGAKGSWEEPSNLPCWVTALPCAAEPAACRGELLSTSRRMGTRRGRLPNSEQLPRAVLKLCITGSFCLLTPRCKCACLWKFSESECTWNNYQIEEMQHIQVNLCFQLKRCEIWNNSTIANRITSDWYEGEQHQSKKDTFGKQQYIILQFRLGNTAWRAEDDHSMPRLHFLCLH